MPLTINDFFATNEKHAKFMIKEVLNPLMKATSFGTVDEYGHPISMEKAISKFYTGDYAESALVYLADLSDDNRLKLGPIKLGFWPIANIHLKVKISFMAGFEYPTEIEIAYNTATDLKILEPAVADIMAKYGGLSVTLKSEDFHNYVDVDYP